MNQVLVPIFDTGAVKSPPHEAPDGRRDINNRLLLALPPDVGPDTARFATSEFGLAEAYSGSHS
jgi:hypothetical protein